MTWQGIRGAARDYGWLLSLVVSLASVVIVITLLRAAPEAASTVGIDTGDTFKITPREPGARVKAAEIVCDPSATVAPPSPFIAPDATGPVVKIMRGQETIEWASANFTNQTGTYYSPANVPDDADFDATAIQCVKRKMGIR